MSEHPVKRRKKLIEVAIPLEAIDDACAHEKKPGIGAHPRGLHWWWARRPLAAARAVIFCQMVDDPSAVPEEFPLEEDQENERLRLFLLISKLVKWENTINRQVLEDARKEIFRSWSRACRDNAEHPDAASIFNPDKLPAFYDPFAGGGALPLEAQRLGLDSYATDLNPVAVLINKAMIDIPSRLAGVPPVNPKAQRQKELVDRKWGGADGLAEDVCYYGEWLRSEAEKRIGRLYPKALITQEMANERPDLKAYEGEELKVLTWLWTRTVSSPNPAFSNVMVPLAPTFMLSTKAGKEAYVEPVIERGRYRFTVKMGKPRDPEKTKSGTSAGRWNAFTCLMSGSPISYDYIRSEGCAGRLGYQLMAIVAEGKRGRIYLSPSTEMVEIAESAQPSWKPDLEINYHPRDIKTQIYGLETYGDLFTNRQLTALATFSDLLSEARRQVRLDASEYHAKQQAEKIADAITVYLACAISRLADFCCTLSTWKPSGEQVMHLFTRQAIPMSWDFAESNLLGRSSICLHNAVKYTAESLAQIGFLSEDSVGVASQADAAAQNVSANKIVSTDPPYYDNIGYADLSDFFYVWLRRHLKDIYPELFATVAVPKAEELVATPYRHGNKSKADSFFLQGMTSAMKRLASSIHPAFPLTIYYAFKQSETTQSKGIVSTGWETFLAAVLESGLAITGTWPLRTEQASRMIGIGSNALASSVVLVCSRRDPAAKTISRNEFRRELRASLPVSIEKLERASIAPVDMAQAAIGPGMAIYSQAKSVVNTDDTMMSVRDALIEINAALDDILAKDESSLDPDSQFGVTFFESFGYSERDFGDAEGLAKARNISVAGVAESGILRSVAGKVRLLKRSELEDGWDPSSDKRLCVWEATQQLIRRLEAEGEAAAASLLSQLKKTSGHGDLAANCRALAYRLYSHCEKSKQAEEARAYNGLVIAWPELERLASNQRAETAVQASLI